MAGRRGPVRGRRGPWPVGLAALAAFVATLAIPAVSVLWWLLVAAALAAGAISVSGARPARVSPAGEAARGR